MKTLFSISILLILSFTSSAAENLQLAADRVKSAGVKIKVEKVMSGLGIPWGMAFISPTKLLITEREGNVLFVDLKSATKLRLKNVPEVFAEGQGGMLDVAVPPDYQSSQWIYFTYVKDTIEGGATTLARAKLDKDQLLEWKDLLVTNSATSTGYHFGSRIAFDEQGHVYFGIGDRGERPNSQDMTNHAGCIMRLNRDGSVPQDNPFVKNKKGLPEVWSYGHRNPQGLSYDFKNKRLWEIEHGPRGGDEINLIQPGKNYGWPVISYGKEYWGPVSVGEGTHRKGMEQPVKVYIPSIAPGSLIVYSGDAFPNWKGNLLAGALKLQHINRVVIDEKGKAIKEERLFKEVDQRIRSLAQSPEGWIYFATDSGNIYRVSPAI